MGTDSFYVRRGAGAAVTQNINRRKREWTAFEPRVPLPQSEATFFPIWREPRESIWGAIDHVYRFRPKGNVWVCGHDQERPVPFFQGDNVVRKDRMTFTRKSRGGCRLSRSSRPEEGDPPSPEIDCAGMQAGDAPQPQ